jgi:hypothetical protein
MLDLNAYLLHSDGSETNEGINLTVTESDGAYAVKIDAKASKPLNLDFGARIDISIEDAASFVADYRDIEWWCKPHFAQTAADIPDETQGLIYKKLDGSFGVILPVVSENYKCVLLGNENGTISARIFSWLDGLTDISALAFVYSEGKEPFSLLEKCTKYALSLLPNAVLHRAERKYPEPYEYLGWCSWDAMEIRVNEADIIRKCEEFKQKDIPVKWIIIDDMWAEVRDFYGKTYSSRREMAKMMHASRLYAITPDPYRFPNGLKPVIDKVKSYGISVGMWHPTTGYWFGLDKDGPAYATFRDTLIETEDGRFIPSYEYDKAFKFYDGFHSYLKSCGAELIKVDNQSITRRFYRNLTTVGKAARSFHDAIESSVEKNFGGAMINCMGMASEDMWQRRASAIARCSNDFHPNDAAWFVNHILQCSYNDLIQGQFHFCDWDMWWTDDAQAKKNSVLRAISGGPIYVSDMIDRSRKEVITPLVFEDGRILRADKPAMPTADCITDDPEVSGRAFKLHNTVKDSGVIAAFNLDSSANAVTATISPSDVYGLSGDSFAVYEHFSRQLRIMNYTDSFNITLKDKDDFVLYTVAPIKDGFAPLGRIDKYLSYAGVKDVCGKNIILIDDVFTTGYTLDYCAKALKEQGADNVIAITVTHGTQKGHSDIYYDLFS